MAGSSFVLPEATRLRAHSLGPSGRAWVANLDSVVATLAERWQLNPIQVLTGGSESLVVAATDAHGEPAVLKLGLPGSADLTAEANVYRQAAGCGYARLIAEDPTHNALVLERLGAPLAAANLPIADQLRVICQTLMDCWRTPAITPGLMTGVDKCAWLQDFIATQWQALGQPTSRAVYKRALAYIERRASAHRLAHSVLVHGDAHNLNALRCSDQQDCGYKFVDPDGMFAERACDLAVPMREWCEELLNGNTIDLALQRCHALARLCDVEPVPIWEWGYVERVSTGLVLQQIGMAHEAADYFAVSERLAAVTP